jgi:sugar phosphate isomerase/epimerase
MNQLGWCSGIGNAELLGNLGYNFIEVALNSLQLENKNEYKELIKPVLASPLPTKAFNMFFPQGLRIVGPEANESRIRNYITLAVETLVRTKASIIVLGSAGARHIPEGWERQHAEEQFLKVLSWCADEMQGTSIILAIEPLNRQESNFINSVEEGVHFARQINRAEIQVLADFYHMDEEQEPLDTLMKHKEWLAHIHLADTGRKNPGSGQYDYDTFVSILKEIEYTGMISSECFVDDPRTSMEQSMAFIKKKWSI